MCAGAECDQRGRRPAPAQVLPPREAAAVVTAATAGRLRVRGQRQLTGDDLEPVRDRGGIEKKDSDHG